MAEGLLTIQTDRVPEGDEESRRLHLGYAEQLLAVPGVLGARCYEGLNAYQPFMTLCELADVTSAQRHERVSELDRAAAARVDVFRRRVFELVSCRGQGGGAGPDAALVLMIGMSLRGGGIAELQAWYDEEHVPALLRVPGWLRARCYRMVEGYGPDFLALHELASEGVLAEPGVAEASDSPWRTRIAISLTRREQDLYRHRRSYSSPRGGTT